MILSLCLQRGHKIKIPRQILYVAFSVCIIYKLSQCMFNFIFLSQCGQPVIATIFFQFNHEGDKIS